MFFTKPNINFDQGGWYKEPTAPDNPATAGEVFDTAWDASNRSELFFSGARNITDTYEAHNKRVKELTGAVLPNPATKSYWEFDTEDDRAAYYRDLGAYKADGGELSSGAYQMQWREQRYRKALADLVEQHPQHRSQLIPEKTFQEQSYGLASDTERKAEETWERSGKSMLDWAAWIGGNAASGLTDPVNIITAPLGFGGVGTGLRGLAMGFLKTGTSNAAVEAAVQPFVQNYRSQAGMESGLAMGAMNVGAAFTLGGALDLGIRGTARGLRWSLGYEPVVDAKGVVIGYKKIVPSQPVDPAAPVKAADSDPSFISKDLIDKADAEDPAAMRAVAEKSGLINEPLVRSTFDAMDANERMVGSRPSETIADGEHAKGIVQTLRHVNEPELEPMPVVRDGTTLDTIRSLDLDMAEVRAEIRLLKERAPADAEGLAKLETRVTELRVAKFEAQREIMADDLIQAVDQGRMPQEIADLVVDHVADKAIQGRVASDLAKMRPASPTEARHRLAQILSSPDYRPEVPAVPARGNGLARPALDDPYGADAKAQVAALEKEMAQELDAAGVKREGAEAKGKVEDGGKDGAKPDAMPEEIELVGKMIAEVRKAVDDVRKVLPADTRVGVVPGDIMSGGKRIDAVFFTDQNAITLALTANNPAARLHHEAVHALRTAKLLTDDEIRLLAEKGNELHEAISYEKAKYEAEYATRFTGDALKEALDQEAAAHLVEARIRGMDLGPKLNAIADFIAKVLERIRNGLDGLGFKTADDVIDAILSGEVARRQAIQSFMEKEDITAVAVRPQREATPSRIAEKATPEAAAAVDDFISSVDGLKSRLGVRTRQRDFNGPLYAMAQDAQVPATVSLKDAVAEIKRGSRIGVIMRYVDQFTADVDEITASVARAEEVPLTGLDAPRLRKFVVAVEDLQQVISDRVDAGYKLSDDAFEIGQNIEAKLEDMMTRLSDVGADAEARFDNLQDYSDRLAERRDELLYERFGDDEAAIEAYADSLANTSPIRNENTIAQLAPTPDDGVSVLDIAGDDADLGSAIVAKYDSAVIAIVEKDPSAMALAEVENVSDFVYDLVWQYRSAANYIAKTETWVTETYSAFNPSKMSDELIIPAVERLESSAEKLDEIASVADDLLGGAVGDSTMFAFAGERAKTADLDALALAKRMTLDGIPRDDIWTKTGWGRGVDGKWRFEIDDSGASIAAKTGRLRDVLKHPYLAAAYPEVGRSTVGERRGASSTFLPGGTGPITSRLMPHRIEIGRRSPDPLSSLLHEGQHGIQRQEAFSRGGRLGEFKDENLLDADTQYERLAGEVEARTVQKRMDMSAAERRSRPMWYDYDVPEDQQIVRFGDSGPMYSLGDGDNVGLDAKLANFEAIRAAIDSSPREQRRPLMDGYDVEVWPSVGNVTYYVVERGKKLADKKGNISSVGRFVVKPAQRLNVLGVEVTNAGVSEGHQRKGIARAVYDMAERDFAELGGVSPSPRDQLSPDGKAFWEKRMPGVMFAMAQDTETGRSMRRDMDALGYFSGALEAAKGLKQAKGTPEQMLAQLKAGGAKQAELEATGLLKWIEEKSGSRESGADAGSGAVTEPAVVGPNGERTSGTSGRADRLKQPSISKSEIIEFLEKNRVGVKETKYGDPPYDVAALIAEAKALEPKVNAVLPWPGRAEARERWEFLQEQIALAGVRTERKTKWSTHSLDPSNPTYRETVIHLPDNTEGMSIEERFVNPDGSARLNTNFQYGHFPEPNIIGHMMTSMTKHEGKPVYTIDQIQSDWGQKLRDGGVRDEAKIAELRKRSAELGIDDTWISEAGGDWDRAARNARDQLGKDVAAEMGFDNPDARRIWSELKTAESGAVGHPIVNTTDQWTNTTLRRALRQAAEADAEYIAVPSGKTVLSYNPGDEHGMEGFYDKIVPKNLRNLIQKLDKDAPTPVKIDKLETPTSGMKGEGFTLFPLTDKVKSRVLAEGQPLFAMRNDGRKTPGSDARKQYVKEDFDAIDAKFQNAGGDERLKLQAKRAALLNAKAHEKVSSDVMNHRDLGNQTDPGKAMMMVVENQGQATFQGLTTIRDIAIQTDLGEMGKMMWEMRKGAVLGDKRRNTAPVKTMLHNVIREAWGKDSGDATAKQFAQAYLASIEKRRQRWNHAGGDIKKLEGYAGPQYHDPEAWAAAGREEIVKYFTQDGVLDRSRMISFDTGAPMTDAELSDMMKGIWRNVVTEGAAAFEEGASAGAGRPGAKYKQRMEHRVLHFKDADSWLAYNEKYGSGDVYASVVGEAITMNRDIALMERLGANPLLTWERLKADIVREAQNAVAAKSLYDEFVDKIESLRAKRQAIPNTFETLRQKMATDMETIDQLKDESKTSKRKAFRNRPKISALTQGLRETVLAIETALKDGAETPEQLAITNEIGDLMAEMVEAGASNSMSRNPLERTQRLLKRADEMMKSYMGATNVPLDDNVAAFMSGTRNMIGAGGLVYASISALSDQLTQSFARLLNGLPLSRQISSYVKAFTKLDRQFALDTAIGLESVLPAIHESNRFVGSLNARHITGYIADRSHAFSFLTPMTSASKLAFSIDFMGEMARIRGLGYGEIGEVKQRIFERHGISPQEWDQIRAAEPETHRGREHLTRRSIAKVAGDEIADKYLGMIYRERSYSTVEGIIRGRTAFISDTQPGSAQGEALRSAATFKSFPTSYGIQIFGRLYEEVMKGRAMQPSVIGAAAAIFIGGTIMGALVIQLKQIAQGKDPRDMTDPKFWAQAFMQSGGLGIYGDFVASSINRQGSGLSGTIAGPVADLGGNVLDLTFGNIAQYASDEKTNAGREAVKLMRRLTPGMIAPWYIRTAVDRMVFDELQKVLDPEAHRSFQSRMRTTKKVGGNDFFWAPGSSEPQRGPNMGAIFGR